MTMTMTIHFPAPEEAPSVVLFAQTATPQSSSEHLYQYPLSKDPTPQNELLDDIRD